MLLNFIKCKAQIIAASCVYLGQMLGGFVLSWTAPVIPKLDDKTQSPLTQPLSDIEKSLLASVLYITGFAGLFFASWLSNTKGRKPTLILGSTIVLISFLVLAYSTNFASLLVGRLICGLGVGQIAVINMIYIGEIASTNIRGIFLSTLDILQTCGSLLLVSSGPYVSYKMLNYIGATVTLFSVLALLLIPESPVFYVIKDDEKNVKATLERLDRVSEMKEIFDLNKDRVVTSAKDDWRELFTSKCNRRGLLIMTTIMSLQYLSGMLVVQFFVTSIFEIAKSSIKPEIATIIIGCTQLSGGLIVPFVIENAGRRRLLLGSTALCCVSMTIFGLYFYLKHIQAPIVDTIQWLPLTVLVVFFLSNNMGFGTIPSTLTGEMFTGNVRGKGAALVTCISWAFGFAVTTVFNTMLTELGPHYMFWFFASTCGLAFIFTLFFVPETQGKSLVEIQEMLNK
ncbi:unnamed protein product [Leptosia nina]|uniref:Major facilitator superfamily (MFS) profile domain-containing protein n=1 Tax=Leptosia nina TaxID=320188 RepID=A0AAV1IYD6_9NEOP